VDRIPPLPCPAARGGDLTRCTWPTVQGPAWLVADGRGRVGSAAADGVAARDLLPQLVRWLGPAPSTCAICCHLLAPTPVQDSGNCGCIRLAGDITETILVRSSLKYACFTSLLAQCRCLQFNHDFKELKRERGKK
jgi:hypothetical protein